MYDSNTVYVIGHGKTSADNAITANFSIFFIAFVVDCTTDKVIDLECTATLDITKRFTHSLFVGADFSKIDENLVNEISNRYFGTSQKALIVAYKGAVKKYLEIKSKKD